MRLFIILALITTFVTTKPKPVVWAEYQDGVLIVIEDGAVIHKFERVNTLKKDYIIFER